MRISYVILITIGVIFALMLGSFLLGISMAILPKENLIRDIERLYEHRVVAFIFGLSLYVIGYIVTKTMIKRLTKEEVFVAEGDFGRVAVSTMAVEDVVRKVIRNFDFIKKYKLSLHPKGKKLTIDLKIKQWEGQNVLDDIEPINLALKEKLDRVVGLCNNFEIEIKIEKIEDKAWA